MKKSIFTVVAGLVSIGLVIIVTVFIANRMFDDKMTEQENIINEYKAINESLFSQVDELESLIASTTVSEQEYTTDSADDNINQEIQDTSWMNEYGDNQDSNLGWDETKPEMEYVGIGDVSQYGWDADNLNEIIHDFSKNVFNIDPAQSEFVTIEINSDGNQEVIFNNDGKEYRVILTMDKMLVKAVRPE